MALVQLHGMDFLLTYVISPDPELFKKQLQTVFFVIVSTAIVLVYSTLMDVLYSGMLIDWLWC